MFRLFVPFVILGCVAHAQVSTEARGTPQLGEILSRLERVESQNRELMAEVRVLREMLGGAPAQTGSPAEQAAPAGTIAERMEVQEQRTAQLDQEKISSDHKLPVQLTGMILFNAFLNGRGAVGAENPTIAPARGSQASGGGTLRQTVLGFKVDGPQIVGGGKVTGSVYMDLFGGTGTTLNQLMRLRVAAVDATWRNTTLMFGLDKPILAPREPDSLAQVGVSPLTSAGNLWLWQPQARIEQRFSLGEQAGLRAQVGLFQTAETSTGLPSETLTRARPGYEGRFEFWGDMGDKRIEVAPGFHASSTHALGQTADSRIFSIDWMIRPLKKVDFSGQFFQGQNVGILGGLRQSVTIFSGRLRPVEASGGWAQLKVRIAPRVTFNAFGGQEDDNNRDLLNGAIAKNQAYAANIMYRAGSNILTSFEVSQVRTTYLGAGTRIFAHYDLAIAYLF